MEYVVVIAAVGIFWLLLVDRPVLKIKMDSGKVTSIKGHMPPSFRHNLEDIIEHHPCSGELKVYQQRRKGMKLVFSKGMPSKVQQRIRNVFPHQGFRSDKGKKVG